VPLVWRRFFSTRKTALTFPEAERVAGLEDGVVDRLPPEKRPVDAGEVLEDPPGGGLLDLRVLAGHREVGKPDLAVDVTADDGASGDLVPLSPPSSTIRNAVMGVETIS